MHHYCKVLPQTIYDSITTCLNCLWTVQMISEQTQSGFIKLNHLSAKKKRWFSLKTVHWLLVICVSLCFLLQTECVECNRLKLNLMSFPSSQQSADHFKTTHEQTPGGSSCYRDESSVNQHTSLCGAAGRTHGQELSRHYKIPSQSMSGGGGWMRRCCCVEAVDAAALLEDDEFIIPQCCCRHLRLFSFSLQDSCVPLRETITDYASSDIYFCSFWLIYLCERLRYNPALTELFFFLLL